MKKEYKNLLLIAGGTFIGLSIIFRKPLTQGGKKILEKLKVRVRGLAGGKGRG